MYTSQCPCLIAASHHAPNGVYTRFDVTAAPGGSGRAALDAGADALELDLRITRDGALIAAHDSDASTTTDAPRWHARVAVTAGPPVRPRRSVFERAGRPGCIREKTGHGLDHAAPNQPPMTFEPDRRLGGGRSMAYLDSMRSQHTGIRAAAVSPALRPKGRPDLLGRRGRPLRVRPARPCHAPARDAVQAPTMLLFGGAEARGHGRLAQSGAGTCRPGPRRRQVSALTAARL